MNASDVAGSGRGIPAGGIMPALTFRITFSQRSACAAMSVRSACSSDSSPVRVRSLWQPTQYVFTIAASAPDRAAAADGGAVVCADPGGPTSTTARTNTRPAERSRVRTEAPNRNIALIPLTLFTWSHQLNGGVQACSDGRWRRSMHGATNIGVPARTGIGRHDLHERFDGVDLTAVDLECFPDNERVADAVSVGSPEVDPKQRDAELFVDGRNPIAQAWMRGNLLRLDVLARRRAEGAPFAGHQPAVLEAIRV